ncbi:hypothetical protein SCE1572_49510 [Sorangium cellulosum So0157-2]|uniref:Uncharacterized protein n=1 Tax=Sorangium cellulosum So0157-2 TaxID=1254432 RepID=S4YBW0_SORCE|nr:hypothetical protein SCE1572_49510 [Sorangium cellulosum So0157-2]
METHVARIHPGTSRYLYVVGGSSARVTAPLIDAAMRG